VPTHVALLRGINLGPHKRVAMPALRALVEGLGHADVVTYIASGNVVFTAGTAESTLADDLEKAIADELGVTCRVVTLSRGPVTIHGVNFDVSSLLFCGAATVLGAQLVSFWAFAEIFAMGEGLIPADPKLVRAFDYVTLEVGLAIGVAMLVSGLLGAIIAVQVWRMTGYGPLNAAATMRVVIPSVTLMILGAQAIMSSFFLSVLGLRRR